MLTLRAIRPSATELQARREGRLADAFPISGQIDPKAFPFLLMDLHRHGATGSLKVEGPSYQKALYFRGGRILFGSSNDPRDQLGRHPHRDRQDHARAARGRQPPRSAPATRWPRSSPTPAS